MSADTKKFDALIAAVANARKFRQDPAGHENSLYTITELAQRMQDDIDSAEIFRIAILQQKEYIGTLEAAVADTQKRATGLKEALSQYGQHVGSGDDSQDCALMRQCWPNPKCDCGLDAALEEVK